MFQHLIKIYPDIYFPAYFRPSLGNGLRCLQSQMVAWSTNITKRYKEVTLGRKNIKACFVLRRNSSIAGRNIVNRDQLISYMKNKSYALNVELDFKFLEKLDWPSTTLAYLQQIDVLIGASGAGFTNQLFMRPNSKVITIECSQCCKLQQQKEPTKWHSSLGQYLRISHLNYFVESTEFNVDPVEFWRIAYRFLRRETTKYGEQCTYGYQNSSNLTCGARVQMY